VVARANDPASAEDRAGLLRLLAEAEAVRFGRFTLASGQTSDVYVDIKRVWTRPEYLRPIANAFASRLGDAERLAGAELGAVPLVVATALETGLPYVVVRRAAKEHGTRRRLEGDIPDGSRTLVLEDVTTTGGSLVDAVAVLREAGARVERAIAVVDRDAGAVERLAAVGVRLEALATLAELRTRAA
jgi:orotate phosphoribosyltransferase